jgi:hypothetical protein
LRSISSERRWSKQHFALDHVVLGRHVEPIQERRPRVFRFEHGQRHDLDRLDAFTGGLAVDAALDPLQCAPDAFRLEG